MEANSVLSLQLFPSIIIFITFLLSFDHFFLFLIQNFQFAMSRPYSRSASDRSKKKAQNSPADNDTQSLVNSLPASLRFLQPQASQSSSQTNLDTVPCDRGRDEMEDRSEHEESDCNSNHDDDEEETNETRVEQDDDDPTNRDGHDNDESGLIDPEGLCPPHQHQGGSANPVADLFRTADPAVPSVRRPMAPGDRSRFDQVANIFSLESNYQAEALRLGSITGNDNRYWTLLCLQQLTRQEFAKKAASSSTEWTPKPKLVEQLKRLIRCTLCDSSIESYTETLDQNKVIIPGSLHRKTMQAIMGQSKDWKAEYLPANFGTTLDDLSNHERFMEILRAKLRHARDDFRLVLLQDIAIPQRKIDMKEPQNEVPSLGSLLGQLYHFFNPNESRTVNELLKQVNTKTQSRFAYLRIELGMYHETSAEERKEQGGLSNWRLIDHNLAAIGNKSRDYRRAFNAIILARNQGLFNGKNKWDQIKSNEQLKVPSEEDIMTAIPFLPANSS
ncbi:hypothetical protein DFH28DRAFT_1218322 [Melampsora americana]|nr:hypothetical protein DFH28DRAFT_1218322 [Melampsora americana]